MEDNNTTEKGTEFENIQLNDMFSLTYNFDILKYIINNLIKNQQKLNCRLIELKIDKVYNEMKFDELESNIIDLQKSQNNIKDDKKGSIKKKSKTKNYKGIIDKLTREKDNSLRLLKNTGSEKIILNEKNEKTIDEEFKEDNEYNDKMNEQLKEEIKDEINEMINGLKKEINNKINDNKEKLEEKVLNLEKIITLINNETKIREEKMNTKLSEELPKLFENLFSEKIAKVNSQINNIDQNFKQNVKTLESMIKDTNENLKLDDLKFQDNIKENQKTFKELFKQSTKLDQRINDYVDMKKFNTTIKEIENKMKKDNKDFNNNILMIEQNIEKIENEISDMKNDKTNKNNFLLLSRRCDNLHLDFTKLKEIIMDFDSDRKKLADLNPNKLIFKNNFDEFIESNNKVIEDIKKYLGEMGYMMEDIKTTSSKSMASLKDLKNLEDKLISKMLEFGEQINEKFADKKFVLRNNRFLKIEIKQKLDENKNTDQRIEGGGWLLSKRPIGGHLCASCESYIGDLKENEKYIPWNQYPKDPNDKLNKINHVFSKMLQKFGTDYKIHRNKSTLDINPTKINQDTSLDDLEVRQISTNLTNNRKIPNSKDIIFEKNKKKKLTIKAIPKLKFAKKDDFINNKYKSLYNLNSKTEKDENIVIPETVLGYRGSIKNEEDNSQPKVMKVFKKLI